jgi:UDP-3-O-[3-hydroxymyristoyl] glucosamine N-acyltransferase
VSRAIRLDELARRVGARVVGDGSVLLEGVATLEEAGPRDLSFFTNPRYRDEVSRTRAAALLVKAGSGIRDRVLLEADDPYLALAAILALFHPPEPDEPRVSELASVDPDARLGEAVDVGPFAVIGAGAVLADRVRIGAGCVVGRRCRIGEDSVLMPRVVLYADTSVGRRCIVHAGVVLGADGFGFATSGGVHHKVPQVGRVVVEDDVEIGANSTVDRGALGETVIGTGSKLDDQVMIGHGVRIGKGCLMAAQSGIAGSSRVGDRVTLAGQSGIGGHRRVADGTVVAAKSALLGDTERGGVVAGIPAFEHASWKRAQAVAKRLPELLTKLRKLERKLAALERDADEREEQA